MTAVRLPVTRLSHASIFGNDEFLSLRAGRSQEQCQNRNPVVANAAMTTPTRTGFTWCETLSKWLKKIRANPWQVNIITLVNDRKN